MKPYGSNSEKVNHEESDVPFCEAAGSSRVPFAKKKVRFALLGIIGAVILIIAAVCIRAINEKDMKCKHANQHFSSEDYEEDFKTLQEIEEYKDTKSLKNDELFLLAEELLDAGSYDEAKELYAKLEGVHRDTAAQRISAIDCVDIADRISNQLMSENSINLPDWYLSMFGLDFSYETEYNPKEFSYYFRTIYPSSFSDLPSVLGMSFGEAVGASGGMDVASQAYDIYTRFYDAGIENITVYCECYDYLGECFASDYCDKKRYKATIEKQKKEDEARGIVRTEDFVIQNGVLEEYTGRSTEVRIPDGVVTISQSAFCDNKTITSVVMPDTVETIADFAFNGCKKLSSVAFSKNLRDLGFASFVGCAIENISLPKTLEYGYNVFTYNPIKSITFEEGITAIPEGLVGSVQRIENVNIPEGVEKIGDNAFGFSPPKSIILPSTLSEIGSQIIGTESESVSYRGTILQWSKISGLEGVHCIDGDYYYETAINEFGEDATIASPDEIVKMVIHYVDSSQPITEDITLDMDGHDCAYLAVTAYDSYGAITTVPFKWYSSNESVCTVNAASGRVTAVGAGECDIITKYHEVSAKCHIIVTG